MQVDRLGAELSILGSYLSGIKPLNLFSGSQRSHLQGFEPLQRSCRLGVNPSTKGRRNLLGAELRIQEDPDLRDPSSHTFSVQPGAELPIRHPFVNIEI